MKGFFCLALPGNVHYGGEAAAAGGSRSHCTTDQEAESNEGHALPAATFFFSPENGAIPSESFPRVG